MKESQSYVVTQDTQSILNALDRQPTTQVLQNRIEIYLQNISTDLKQIFENSIQIRTYKEELITGLMKQFVEKTLQDQPTAVFICLDRFLLFDEQKKEELPIARFSITRRKDGTKVPRAKESSFQTQVEDIKKIFPDIYERPVYILDDGIFSGGTIQDFLDIWEEIENKKLPVSEAVGFMGKDNRPQLAIPTRTNQRISNLYEWIDLRDFGPFGGIQLNSSKSNRVTTSVPYVYPWSQGEDASLNLSPDLFRFSERSISEAIRLIQTFEQETGEKLTFRNLVNSGFGLPTDVKTSIPISINEGVIPYLMKCSDRILSEQKRPVLIFDMDGTLYQLDGDNNGFKRSTLEKTVNRNAISFIQTRITRGNIERASEIFYEAQKDEIGISNFLECEFQIPRKEYFSTVWNINPLGIVRNFDGPKRSIETILRTKPDTKLILLTSAPKVWAENVLKFIGCDQYFESIYTGDQFKKKGEIFSMIVKRYTSERIISIGDQWETDIGPAQAVGLSGIQINSPDEIWTDLVSTGQIFQKNRFLDDLLDSEGSSFLYTWVEGDEL